MTIGLPTLLNRMNRKMFGSSPVSGSASNFRRGATLGTKKPSPKIVGKPTPAVAGKQTPKVIEKPPMLTVERPLPKSTGKPTAKVAEKAPPKATQQPPPRAAQQPPPKLSEKPAPKVEEKPQKAEPETHTPKTQAPAQEQKKTVETPAQPGEELDDTTAEVLEEELDNIMNKLWKCVAGTISNAEESFIVDSYSSGVVGRIRDALGLHVTQRLLKVFNALNVKVHFSTKPEREYLKGFLQKYNFVAFKRLEQETNTFGAQVRTIDDFDALCNDKQIVCGAAKITISPCYQFTKCPTNLKSIYDTFNKDDLESIEDTPKKQIEESGSNEVSKSEGASIETKSETENISNKAMSKTSKEANESNEDKSNIFSFNTKDKQPINIKDSKTDNSVLKSDVKSKDDDKSKTNTITKSSEVDKVNNSTTTTTSAVGAVKVTDSNINTADKPKANLTPNKAICAQKVTTPNTSETKKAVVNVDNNKGVANDDKKNKKAVSHDTKSEVAPADRTKENVDTDIKKEENVNEKQVKKTSIIQTNTFTKQSKPIDSKPTVISKVAVATAKSTHSKNIVSKNQGSVKNVSANSAKIIKTNPSPIKKVTYPLSKKSEKHNDDFEELDDHAILALMSGGIVLDECIGSDDE